jgi:hypothetical protein
MGQPPSATDRRTHGDVLQHYYPITTGREGEEAFGRKDGSREETVSGFRFQEETKPLRGRLSTRSMTCQFPQFNVAADLPIIWSSVSTEVKT